MGGSLTYRREIDGLRALAVLPVILFHADSSVFQGGYVGVDVFFVISGYLITSILQSEIESKKFSFLQFYERRARRILPALFLVLIVSIFFAWQWMLPIQLDEFARSLLSVLLFSSNLFFWRDSGYFSATNHEKPLIHTWSLAVEEQFYFLFPLLLWALIRIRSSYRWFVLEGLCGISLLLACWGAEAKPAATFYLLPTRFWEIGIGAILATKQFRVDQRLKAFLAALGLALILIAIFTFTENTPNPSWFTLLPVLGTCLVIHSAHQENVVGKLLGLSVLVGLGRISYSAYLWHQPVFAFFRIRAVEPPDTMVYIGLIGLILLLSVISWRFIENPFRKTMRYRKSFILKAWISTSCFLVMLGAFIIGKNGVPQRLSEQSRKLAEAKIYIEPPCPDITEADPQSEWVMNCMIGDTNQSPKVALLGDSHASVLVKSFSNALNSEAKAALSFWGWSCTPLMEFLDTSPDANKKCGPLIQKAFQRVLTDPQIQTVVLAGRWSRNLRGTADSDSFRKSLIFTLERLSSAGKKVVVITTVPEYEVDVAQDLTKRSMAQLIVELPENKRIHLKQYLEKNQKMVEIIETITVPHEPVVIKSEKIFCSKGPCRYMDENGEVFYKDGHHLTRRGAEELIPALIQAIKS